MSEPAAIAGLAAVVLAAGASTRMGRPKALLPWRGLRFVDHCVVLASRCAPRVVVSGAAGFALDGARVVRNAEWSAGQFSSLRRGLDEVPAGFGCLLLSVDRPHVRADTIDRLLVSFTADPTRIWQPRLGGRHGHPIVFPEDVVEALRRWRPAGTAREVVRSFADRRAFIDVDDPAILDNLDRPEDLARLPVA